ncbi:MULTISPECIES: Na+/H+ antiporter [Leuconostoc]|uniref:Na+/H+ antiporter n=1 Tax=Leuconostoc TaxID=1243 RepID=UPI0002737CE3|nr:MULTISPECIES: Na+/H+ antiporter [Leuconostoc]KDA48212.1 Na+/H+ antiporter [Leuconostoc pseudomesenteroides 1159]KDA50126.1 Na+/H+ antiporter [Leuconostoc pseudomesenteroides PS12]OQJ69535.1 Na+/H+ antiporter [Leuconostoc pseudomesenteroides]CCJ65718.1 Na+/H+ antiporter [Leuconostoc pseudomesenteroides 4882]MCT4419349.1 Na+/H+ antiporter [Leuconostoc falkenbergense]
MAILELIVILIIAVTVSNVISHFIPEIPVSLFQIVIGLFLAFTFGIYVDVDSHWFMLLFIAPLLFNDAWRFPKRELWELRGPILGNAIILVLLTTLVGGFFIHLLIPQFPRSVALALAAVVSPTDPVAVQAIARRVKLPANVMHVVSGESLINDASGLVSFNTAIKATVAGTFLIGSAIGNFFWMTIVGLIVGLVIGSFVSWLRDSFDRAGLNDVVFHTVVTLVMPFIIYWIAEGVFHSSGVIAVVAGGVLSKILSDQHINARSPEISVVAVRTWEIFVYLLNGTIFVLLGIELPAAMTSIFRSTQIHTGMAIFYGVTVWFIVFAIRTVWAYGTQITYHLQHRERRVSFRTAVTSGLTGVRGAVTMAAVLTVPSVIDDGSAFPQRNLLIFVAAVVVIMSLLVATVMLPIVTKEWATHDFTQPEIAEVEPTAPKKSKVDLTEAQARIFAIQIGIQVLREQQNDDNRTIVYELISRKQQTMAQIRRQLDKKNPSHNVENDRELRFVALEAQRDRLRQLLADEMISVLTYSAQTRRLDRLENLINSDQHYHISTQWLLILIRRGLRSIRIWLSDESTDKFRQETSLAITETSKAAIKALSEYMEKYNGDTVSHRMERQAAYNLIVGYRNRIENEKHDDTPEQRDLDDKNRMELEVKALNVQRETIQQLYEQGRITRQAGINIRQFINYAETAALAGRDEE